MKVAQWLTFAWASLAVAIVIYFAARWGASPGEALRRELSLGAGIGVVLGSPAFLALPFLVYAGRATTSTAQRWILLSPLLVLFLIGVVRGILV